MYYNIYNNRNPSVSPSCLFPASNICNFCDRVIFRRFQMAVNSVLLKTKTSKFSGNANLLVRCNANRKEHLTMYYGWSGNAVKTSKIYSFLCELLILALFCPFGFLLELWFSTNNKPCTNTPYKYRKVWHSCFRYILYGL